MDLYAASDLQVRGLGAYELETPNGTRVFRAWNFRTSGAASLEDTLAKDMQDDHQLRLLVVQGRYDTQTQIADTLYVLDQTNIPWARLTIAYFDGGHILEPKPEVMHALRTFLKAAP